MFENLVSSNSTVVIYSTRPHGSFRSFILRSDIENRASLWVRGRAGRKVCFLYMVTVSYCHNCVSPDRYRIVDKINDFCAKKLLYVSETSIIQ